MQDAMMRRNERGAEDLKIERDAIGVQFLGVERDSSLFASSAVHVTRYGVGSVPDRRVVSAAMHCDVSFPRGLVDPAPHNLGAGATGPRRESCRSSAAPGVNDCNAINIAGGHDGCRDRSVRYRDELAVETPSNWTEGRRARPARHEE
jgi:hypothetical protein